MAEKQNIQGWHSFHPTVWSLPTTWCTPRALVGQANAQACLNCCVSLFGWSCFTGLRLPVLSAKWCPLASKYILEAFSLEIILAKSDPLAFHRAVKTAHLKVPSIFKSFGSVATNRVAFDLPAAPHWPWAQRMSLARRAGIFCSYIFLTCFMSLSTLVSALADLERKQVQFHFKSKEVSLWWKRV